MCRSPQHLLPPDALPSPESNGAKNWRQVQLLRAGFAPGQAAEIAAERSIDLHALIELVEHGCPPELAARIHAPLDHERSQC